VTPKKPREKTGAEWGPGKGLGGNEPWLRGRIVSSGSLINAWLINAWRLGGAGFGLVALFTI
jgi:hypothetical protein